MNRTAIQPAVKASAPLAHATLQRKCACGSHTMGASTCTSCDTKKRPLQAKLRIGASDDPFEHEADRISEQVLAAAPGMATPRIQRLTAGPAPASDGAPDSVDRVLAGPGRALEDPLRRDMEQRFRHDFSRVRVHADGAAARSASDIGARAYTAGHQLVFGAGQFAPSTREGRRLIAHELTHVVQQSGTAGLAQRAPLEIVSADSTGTLGADQRRAASSCDIACDKTSLGTLHAMPLSFHASRGTPLPDAAGADGVGAQLHFIRNATPAPAKGSCAACSDFKIIQIINSNQPADSRGKESFVDNKSKASPFYGDTYASGQGVHKIPTRLADGGKEVKTTHSIYDLPYRTATDLEKVEGKDFFWNAESCVTCVKEGTPKAKDKVLGCATYGFKRAWVAAKGPKDATAAKGSHGPVQAVGPGCLAKPSAHFVKTLQTDVSTSSYKFET